MSLAKTGGAALGKLFRSFTNPKWLVQQITNLAMSIYVINPAGKKATAYLKGHLFNHDEKIGDVYHCNDGHEYIHVNGKTYNYDPQTDTWYDSTHS